MTTLNGDNMIPVRRDEILPRSAGIPSFLLTLHKLYFAITRKKFYPGKAGPIFCAATIPLCPEEIFSCNHFSPPKREKK